MFKSLSPKLREVGGGGSNSQWKVQSQKVDPFAHILPPKSTFSAILKLWTIMSLLQNFKVDHHNYLNYGLKYINRGSSIYKITKFEALKILSNLSYRTS